LIQINIFIFSLDFLTYYPKRSDASGCYSTYEPKRFEDYLYSLNKSGKIIVPNVSDNFIQNVFLMTTIEQEVSQETIDLFQKYYSTAPMVGYCLTESNLVDFKRYNGPRKNDDICAV
jgi:hypothetical protein